MVFTQGRGFVVGEPFGLPHRLLRQCVLVCYAADTGELQSRFFRTESWEDPYHGRFLYFWKDP